MQGFSIAKHVLISFDVSRRDRRRSWRQPELDTRYRMEPLARTSSEDSVKSRRSPHVLSSSSSSLSSLAASRKGYSPAPGTTHGIVERAIISMPPASALVMRQYPSVSSRKLSRTSSSHETATSTAASPAAEDADDTTPTLEGNRYPESTAPLMLPEAALCPSNLGDPETESNRLSFSSLYSLGSAIYDRARGVAVSGPSSAAGSEAECKGTNVV